MSRGATSTVALLSGNVPALHLGCTAFCGDGLSGVPAQNASALASTGEPLLRLLLRVHGGEDRQRVSESLRIDAPGETSI